MRRLFTDFSRIEKVRDGRPILKAYIFMFLEGQLGSRIAECIVRDGFAECYSGNCYLGEHANPCKVR